MNTAHQREQWNREDLELEEEFEDVTSAWHKSRGKPPRPPRSLDRHIKAQAGYQASESLTQSWVLGPGPQLVLVICLLFGIGLFFVASMQEAPQDPENILTDPTEAPSPSSSQATDRSQVPAKLTETGSTNWIRLEFTVDESGKAQNVDIVERCVRPARDSQCLANDTSLDQRAVEAVKDRQYSGTGRQQDVVTF